MSMRVHQLTEVCVLGNEYPCLTYSQIDNIVVWSTGSALHDNSHIVTRQAQGANYREIAALVCKEAGHQLFGAGGDEFLVRDYIGSVLHRGADVCRRQVRIRV